MKKTIVLALALALVGGVAYANFCARDIVPSATLLVPYIVVDTTAAGTPDPNGYTTLTVVTNVSSAKQIIHVTVWSADSEPVVDFDEVLSGYDVWSINWRDLVTGHFDIFDTGSNALGFWARPSGTTATVGTVGDIFGPTSNQYPTGLTPGSNGLANPQDTDYATPTSTGCGFPWGDLSAYAGIIQAGLQAPLVAWTGSYQDTDCNPTVAEIGFNGWLSTLTAHPLFFYATIDSVVACNGLFPNQLEYWTGFTGGTQYNAVNNVLTGYDFYLNFSSNYSESLPAVGLEAYPGWGYVGFYSHAKELADSSLTPFYDDREPLGTAYAFNYFNGGGVTTDVGVWKNYHEFHITSTYEQVLACEPYIYYAWDENENSKSRTVVTCPSGLCFGNPEPNVFPFQTQKVPVTSTNFTGLMTGNGWMLIVFDPSIPSTYWPAGTYAEDYLQAYVFAKYNYGAYSTAVEATTMSNYWCFGTAQQLPFLNTMGTFIGPATP
jgi:hypothetical protein